jgi:hypothetical protein
MVGRFSNPHKRYIREEDNKSNEQIMDKLLIQMSLLGGFPLKPVFLKMSRRCAILRDKQNSATAFLLWPSINGHLLGSFFLRGGDISLKN